MQAETVSVQKLFQDRRQYRVPFFQRPYEWNREDQWERLWADVAEKADIRADGDQPSPHFLGAVVLEPQTRQGLIGVETLNIIDGQQRLTTLQYFLAALAIVLREENAATLLSIVDGCMRNANTDTMRQPEIEIFKVWPTFRDRDTFQIAMDATTLDDLRERFPYSFTQSGGLKKIGVEHPPALEAIWYFADQISQWVTREPNGHKLARLNAISEAIFRDIQLVSISLGEQDDAQIIFETLNGHGAQLHATDLIRNFVFMRADREGVPGNELFDNFWSPFESDFWTQEQRRGRQLKPRMEWFIQTALQAILGDEVEIGRLYATYRRFATGKGQGIKATDQLRILDTHSNNYRQLISGVGEDAIARFGRRTAVWDASTTHAVALRIESSGLPPASQIEVYDDITSYLVRRAICGLTSKNYNKVFLQQLKKLSSSELRPDSLRLALAGLDGDATRWPRDDEFRKAWLNEPVYPGRLDAPRAKAILAEIENGMRSHRSEEPISGGVGNLDVDHILPSSWFEWWPLADGTTVRHAEASAVAVFLGEPSSEKQRAIQRREVAKATMGNLTLLHFGVNRELQHREFAMKREKLFAESNLHLNRLLMRLEQWDETKIAERGQMLFDVAVKLWQHPTERTGG
jgi:Protein of unknown function DUF262/Protein of unknown function (DUF1524)